ncbi:hypothetical protein ES705_49217 [subsurface metagenome]
MTDEDYLDEQIERGKQVNAWGSNRDLFDQKQLLALEIIARCMLKQTQIAEKVIKESQIKLEYDGKVKIQFTEKLPRLDDTGSQI